MEKENQERVGRETAKKIKDLEEEGEVMRGILQGSEKKITKLEEIRNEEVLKLKSQLT